MSLTVTESAAVFDLLRWLADKHDDYIGHKVTDDEAVEAMAILAAAAGRRLQVAPNQQLPILIVERLQAVDSDGAAQAVCRALEASQRAAAWWLDHTTVAAAFEEWRRRQDTALGERLRDDWVDPIDTAWGEVDV